MIKLILFLLVFTEHFFCFVNLKYNNIWSLPNYYNFQFLGGFAVATFFMLTASNYFAIVTISNSIKIFLKSIRNIYLPYLFFGFIVISVALIIQLAFFDLTTFIGFIKYSLFYPFNYNGLYLSSMYANAFWTMSYTMFFYFFVSFFFVRPFGFFSFFLFVFVIAYSFVYPFNNNLFYYFVVGSGIGLLRRTKYFNPYLIKNKNIIFILLLPMLVLLLSSSDSRFALQILPSAIIMCIIDLLIQEFKLKGSINYNKYANSYYLYLSHGLILFIFYTYFSLSAYLDFLPLIYVLSLLSTFVASYFLKIVFDFFIGFFFYHTENL